MNDQYIMKYKCEAFIDQNRYCGNDPVGHACYNSAEIHIPFETGSEHTWFICNECYDQLETNRISFGTPLTDKNRSDRINRAIETFINNLHNE